MLTAYFFLYKFDKYLHSFLAESSYPDDLRRALMRGSKAWGIDCFKLIVNPFSFNSHEYCSCVKRFVASVACSSGPEEQDGRLSGKEDHIRAGTFHGLLIRILPAARNVLNLFLWLLNISEHSVFAGARMALTTGGI